ncbi:MAG: type II secretion system F family protein [Actinobacteria bacterium]|nr:type II secretion system F family protein [Actinomycetota bacterium]
MNLVVIGLLLGLIFGLGIVSVVRASPPMRPIRLADRLTPYLGTDPRPSRLLASPDAPAFGVARRLAGPVIADGVRFLDRVVGGSASVRRRLAALGEGASVEDFRIEQLLCAAAGLAIGGLAAAGFSAATSSLNPVAIGVGAIGGACLAALVRDWQLSRRVAIREATMLAEFPVVADLLALSVVAGEAPVDALTRVCRVTGGEIAKDLERAIGYTRTGTPVTTALVKLAESSSLEPFSRFIEGLVVAIDRGTPLADVLRAQALDVREASKRALLEAGGRKEITMMLPVVFLLLPVTVVFALYPGLLTLVTLTH